MLPSIFTNPDVFLFFVGFALLNMVLILAGLATYAERKISADIQLRIGPNRVGPLGLLQFIADGIKMIFKEDILPRERNKIGFYLGPFFPLLGVFLIIPLIPFSESATLLKTDVGLVLALGISSFVLFGIFLGGISSGSKWSSMGSLRAAGQIVSYEVPVFLSLCPIVILASSTNLLKITSQQGFWPWEWFLFHNPFTLVSFFIFFISSLAEANRAPFDLPEAESELVSGYHTEYSGMKFAFYALAEYVEVFIFCSIATACFLGGFTLPLSIRNQVLSNIIQIAVFIIKTLGLYYVVIWVRWTLPRLRIDQLMSVCWKYLVPLSMINIFGVLIWINVVGFRSILDLVFNFFK